MKKSLFTAALACVLTLGGLTLSAQSTTAMEKVNFDSSNNAFSSKVSESLKVVFLDMTEKGDYKNLSTKLASFITSPRSDGKVFGYMMKNGSKQTFVPLDTPSEITVETMGKLDAVSIPLGKFEQGQTFQFGYATVADPDSFEVINIASVKALRKDEKETSSITVASDPLYYAGYDSDSFYQLDFSNDPFDGNIEILVMGEPLPASTVTLLVALALAAAFLLYNSRRQRAIAEQA